MAHTDPSIETLNTFLRTESSAVEAYRRAIRAVRDELARRTLEDCQHDHEARVESLRRRIEKLGGQPEVGDVGPEAFAQVSEADERRAIEALGEGEDHELDDYQREMNRVHGEARRFMRMELLPRQKRTHERVSRLKRTLH